jgi:transposase
MWQHLATISPPIRARCQRTWSFLRLLDGKTTQKYHYTALICIDDLTRWKGSINTHKAEVEQLIWEGPTGRAEKHLGTIPSNEFSLKVVNGNIERAE